MSEGVMACNCAGIRAEGDDSALHYSANGILYVLRLAYCKNKFGDVGMSDEDSNFAGKR